MELQVGVKALLKNKDGKYLFLKRSAEKYPNAPLEWDIVGGRINPGLTLLDNLKREVKEETGLDLIEEVRLMAAQDILRMKDRHIVRLTYAGEIDGEPKLSEEHTDFKWFSIEELKHFDNGNLDMYFKELLDKGFFG